MTVGGIVGVRSIVDRVCARPDVLEACRKPQPQQHGGELRGGRPDPRRHDRDGRLQEPRWRGAELQPGRVAGLCRNDLGHGLGLMRHAGGGATRRVVCYAVTE